jgi:hypothetical protein
MHNLPVVLICRREARLHRRANQWLQFGPSRDRKSNCAEVDAANGRPQGWRCAPPPSAAGGLDPARSPVFRLCMRSVEDRARRAR